MLLSTHDIQMIVGKAKLYSQIGKFILYRKASCKNTDYQITINDVGKALEKLDYQPTVMPKDRFWYQCSCSPDSFKV
jgi:hypothetical protein